MVENPFLAQFHDDLKARYPLDGTSMSYSEWIGLNTHLRGRRFSTEQYEFQKAILDDMSTDLTVIKPSQVGLTEIQIRKVLAFLARNRGTTAILTFPDELMFRRNSKTRVRPIITSEKVFNQSNFDDKPARSMDLYEIAGSFLLVTGMGEGDATSTPADLLAHDELDLSDPRIISLYQSRLQNSDYRLTHKFSTPSLHGYGIDASYAMSDQHEYWAQCGACNHWQIPRFTPQFVNLPGFTGSDFIKELDIDVLEKCDTSDVYVRCEKCSRQLDMSDASKREWVAAYAARRARGYRVRPFSTSRVKPLNVIDQLIKLRVDDAGMKVFTNTILGETFSDGKSRLEPDLIRKAMVGASVPHINKDVPVALGCDMGTVCHLTLGRIRGELADPFLFEQVHSDKIVGRIAELRAKYNIVTGGVDRLPYTPTANQIRNESNGLILPLEYRQQAVINVRKDEHDVVSYAEINRTAAIDAVVASIHRTPPAIEIAGYGALGAILVEQLCDMVRIENDEKQAVWQKQTGNDHFFHSLVLMRASIKVREIVHMTYGEGPRRLLGMISIPNTAVIANLGALRPRERRAL